jgi:hypothetical protein
MPEFTDPQILEIGKRQKAIIWLILISIPTTFIPFTSPVVGLISIYFIYKLATAVKSSLAWLYIILGFLPLIGLLALLHLNAKATRALRAKGLEVGLMGAISSELDKLL